MSRHIEMRVFCKVHNRWEFYTMGDLACGAPAYDNHNGESAEFDGRTWTPFIGQLDNKKKKIFEGDIVEWKNERRNVERAVVVFNDNGFWCMTEHGDKYMQFNKEVIGNIWEDISLLPYLTGYEKYLLEDKVDLIG